MARACDVKASADVPHNGYGYSVGVVAPPEPTFQRQISPQPRCTSPPRVVTPGPSGHSISRLTWAGGPSPFLHASSPHRPFSDGIACTPSPPAAVGGGLAVSERFERNGSKQQPHRLSPGSVIGSSPRPGEHLVRSGSKPQPQPHTQHPSPRPAAKQQSSPRPTANGVAKGDHADGRSRLAPQSLRSRTKSWNMDEQRPSPARSSRAGCGREDVESNGGEQAQPLVPRKEHGRRFSRGSSLTFFAPGSGDGDVAHVTQTIAIDDWSRQDTPPPIADGDESSLPLGLQPYVPSEISYFGPVPPAISSGSRLRLIAFDFDQTLAATHLFFRLKNHQSRSRASRPQQGRHGGPALTRLLLRGVVPFEEIWGGLERLDYLKAHLQELSRLGVYMVTITKGAGRVVDLALQLAGIREHFQMVLDPNTSTGAKLMTLQVLMNTALSERLRPMEAVLVDDDLSNLVIDISPEEVATLPPVFQAAAPVPPVASCLTNSREFREGHLVGPETVCRLMHVEAGVKLWQLQELVQAATYG